MIAGFRAASRAYCLPRASVSQARAFMSRGAFIVFEGIDRCGKSTQAKRLLDRLKADGVSAELWNFPDRTTTIGQMLNSYLTNSSELDNNAVHLLFAANRWEKRLELERKLSEGITVVVDRYSFSGVAFSAAKGKQLLDASWCKGMEVGLPAPDAVFFLRLSIEAAAKRGGYGLERYEEEKFQQEVLKQFDELKSATWRTLDAGQSIEELEQQIYEAVNAVRERVAELPLGRLWGSAEGAPAEGNSLETASVATAVTSASAAMAGVSGGGGAPAPAAGKAKGKKFAEGGENRGPGEWPEGGVPLVDKTNKLV